MPKRIDFTRTLERLREFYARRRRLPSFSEMQSMLGYRSKGGVAALVDQLVEKGILSKDAQGKLLPTPVLGQGARLLGEVKAGFPAPAEEELGNTLSLDEFLISNSPASYLLKVSGDSMIEAGILPGDYVIAERGRTPADGDIVIAQVDGEWTMKHFRRRKGRTVLEAANPKYPPIEAKKELTIEAVVVSTFRKFK